MPILTNVTLFEEIRRSLVTKILIGSLKPGDKIPTEKQLAQEFKASRPTVNKAISSLARDGLVTRRKRAGTLVLEQSVFFIPITDVVTYVKNSGNNHSFNLVSKFKSDNHTGSIIWPKTDHSVPVLCIECLHYSNTVPIQHEQVLINLNTIPTAEHATFSTTPPHVWLRNYISWASSTHRIGAIGAGNMLARLFGIRRGAPCLGIQQIVENKEDILVISTFTSPAGRFFIEGSSSYTMGKN